MVTDFAPLDVSKLDSGSSDYHTGFDAYSANYRAHRTPPPKLTPCTQYEAEELHGLGDLVITASGEENLYFTIAETGADGFCKLDASLVLALI